MENKKRIEGFNREISDLKYSELLAVGCDGGCFYHCTKGGTQEPECMEQNKS